MSLMDKLRKNITNRFLSSALVLSSVGYTAACDSGSQIPQTYNTQGCIKDSDCKGERICDYESGQCVSPVAPLDVSNSDTSPCQTKKFYADMDKDTYGSDNFKELCGPKGIYTATNSDDCNDNDMTIYPGHKELCDSEDNDCDGQTDEGFNSWENYSSPGEVERFLSVIQTSDLGFIAVGQSSKGNSIKKFDSKGKSEWTKAYSGIPVSVVEDLSNNQYILAGISLTNTSFSGWLSSLDKNGYMNWNKKFDAGNGCFSCGFRAVYKTGTKGFVLTGTKKEAYTYNNIWVVKTDAKGGKVWEKTFGSKASDNGRDILASSDGHLVVVGYREEYGSLKGGAKVLNIDSKGTLVWDQTIGISGDKFYAIDKLSKGGFVAVGATTKGSGNDDAWVVKLDNKGNLVWEKTLGGPKIDFATSVEQTKDLDFIISGFKDYTNGVTFGKKGWLFKMSPTGLVKWESTPAGENSGINSVQQTKDKSFVIAGTKYDGSAGEVSFVMKLLHNGKMCKK